MAPKPLSLDTIAQVYDEMGGWNTTDEFRAAWHLHHDGQLYLRDDLLFCRSCGVSSLDADIRQTVEHWQCEECRFEAENEVEAEDRHRAYIGGLIKARQL